MSGGILYLSYSGMLEPLGQSQVLAYQERLASDRQVHLISFERPEDWAQSGVRESVSQRMKAAGIHWHPLQYHKRFSALATAWDILRGAALGLRLVRKHHLTVIHARSYVPSAMALAIKGFTGAKYVFDMRGFWADERVEGGIWRRGGRMYRVAKWFERRFLLTADHVVSLTHAAVREIQGFPYLKGRLPSFTVIPTCADLTRFRPIAGKRQDRFVLGYVGSAGTWYLFDATVASFAQLLLIRPDALLLIVNRNEQSYIRERLVAGGIPMDAVELIAADHADVPVQMARMNAGIFFIRPSFSKQASAPTKLAEFLGCGIPCLANSGVGDMAGILEGERVGVAVDDMTEPSLRRGIERIVELSLQSDIQARCVTAARRHFSLDEGVARYQAIYRKLASTL